MVPDIRIEVTAIHIAGAITTDGGIGIATLETAVSFRQGCIRWPELGFLLC